MNWIGNKFYKSIKSQQKKALISNLGNKITKKSDKTQIKKYDLKVIDFLKIDTEGFEIEVLEGAKAALQGKRVNFIFIESTLIEKSEIHTHMDKIKSELLNYDYKLVAIYDQMIFPKFRQGFFNALFTSL